jgi:hypothetical protein
MGVSFYNGLVNRRIACVSCKGRHSLGVAETEVMSFRKIITLKCYVAVSTLVAS